MKATAVTQLIGGGTSCRTVHLDRSRVVGWTMGDFDQRAQVHFWRPILDNGVTLDLQVTDADRIAWEKERGG